MPKREDIDKQNESLSSLIASVLCEFTTDDFSCGQRHTHVRYRYIQRDICLYSITNPTSPSSGVPLGLNQKDPSEFCPQRYLCTDENGRLYAKSTDTKKGAFLTFGYGLRRYPGLMYAETLKFFTFISLLKTFEIPL
jgi:hypothetical protein